MAEVELTQQYLKDTFEYKDGSLYWKNAFSKHINGRELNKNSYLKNGYRKCNILGKTYRLHRIIFFYHFGYFPQYVDHIDGNKLNNNIENLRECNNAQNGYNRRIPKSNTSGVKGVHKERNRWVVRISINGKKCFIGSYENKDDAILVNTAVRKYCHSEFYREG